MLVEQHCLSPRNARPPGRKRTAAPGGLRDGGKDFSEAGELQAAQYHDGQPSQASSPAAPTAADRSAPTAGDRAARECALGREQLCARLGIDRSTLWRRIKAGRFPDADLVVNGRPAWSAQALAAWERPEGLTRAQVCQRFNVTRQTLWNWTRSGFFPAPDVRVRGREAWSPQAVQAWLDEKDAEARLRYEEREFDRRLEERWREMKAQMRREAAAHVANVAADFAAVRGNPKALSEAAAYDACAWVPGSTASQQAPAG